jgi:hypothetical protein
LKTHLGKMSDDSYGLPLLLLYGDEYAWWVQDNGILCVPKFSLISSNQVPKQGGHVQQALVSLSIGNGPLPTEDKSTHKYDGDGDNMGNGIGNNVAGDKEGMARATRALVTNAVATVAIILASAVAAAIFIGAAATTVAQRCCPWGSHCSGCCHRPPLGHRNQMAIAWAIAMEAIAMATGVAGKQLQQWQ